MKLLFQASKPYDERITIFKSELMLMPHAHPSERANYFKSISSINMFSFSNQTSEYGMLHTKPIETSSFFHVSFGKYNVNNTNHNECLLFKR